MLSLRGFLLTVCFVFLAAIGCIAQGTPPPDSLHLSVRDAESLFLKKNFELLAARFQVNEADAAVTQAKLWNNPTLYFENGAYNPNTGKWFDLSETGEINAGLNQLIHLAGQRNKNVQFEKTRAKISLFQFYDLMRTLRYELRTSLYALYFLRQSSGVYEKELASLDVLLAAYAQEYQKGNIAFKEMARLEALRFNLGNEQLDVLKEIGEKQSTLSLMIGDTVLRTILPDIPGSFLKGMDAGQFNYTQLLDSGMSNRYDLRAASLEVDAEKANLSLQKALQVPDLHLGVIYDRAGSYITNYNAVSVGIDLPFFNRNQGNVKAAEYRIEESRLLKSEAEAQVRNDIAKAYNRLTETERLYESASEKFTGDYDRLLDGVLTGYQNRTISLLEFIDTYETYKNSKIEFNRLQNNRLDAWEDLNLATGTPLIN